MILTGFHRVEPLFRTSQADALRWLTAAHVRAQAASQVQGGEADTAERFASRMAALFRRYGCSPDRIRTRGHDNPDFTHNDWQRMELFSLSGNPQGPTTSERMAAFRRTVDRVCGEIYAPDDPGPDHLIHVTCTGYLSPSCAQELTVRRGWQNRTTVTHAYHMGCSAALPAVRIAGGFLAAGARRADILHTEICSIHLQPHDHTPEQLVVQSLFADGFIRYSAIPEADGRAGGGSPGMAHDGLADVAHGRRPSGRGLRALAMREVLVPDSAAAITWECGEWGMRMGLSRDVPDTICAVLKPYLETLCASASRPVDPIRQNAVFAIHPGGPKIIDQIQSLLGLSESQIGFSAEVLRERGNMSSATLPHIWERILDDPSVPAGTPVVSLAFGPGLCISGAVFEVIG